MVEFRSLVNSNFFSPDVVIVSRGMVYCIRFIPEFFFWGLTEGLLTHMQAEIREKKRVEVLFTGHWFFFRRFLVSTDFE